MLKEENKVFITSLYKIDYIIKEKEAIKKNKEMTEEIKKKLLAMYLEYINVASKVALDTLPLY